MNDTVAITRTLRRCALGAGEILLDYFGGLTNPRQKESPSSIVCDADLAAEAFILKQLQKTFPDHGIISEESGRIMGKSEYTWVVDPLDGTSNFVARLPWFGVLMGVLRGTTPIAAVMYRPTEKVLYSAEAGGGARRNGKPVRVSAETNLKNVLCAFGFDPAAAKRNRHDVELLFRVSQAVRNVRTTNSLVDFCYTLEGGFGACINLKTKIWDIVPISLILPEAGGKFTDLDGRKISFRLDDRVCEREYKVLGANRPLHSILVKLIRSGR